jgi:hypothetical protein
MSLTVCICCPALSPALRGITKRKLNIESREPEKWEAVESLLDRLGQLLVTANSICVSVFIRLTEIALVHFAITETRTVVFRRVLVGTLTLIPTTVPILPITAALFDAFAETSVQSGLTQLE